MLFSFLDFSVVDLTREHANEDEKEEESGNCEQKHEDAMHETCYYISCRVIDLLDFSVGLLYVLHLHLVNIFDHPFILLELFLEAFRKIFHSSYHLKHIIFDFGPILSLIVLDFVKVYCATYLVL